MTPSYVLLIATAGVVLWALFVMVSKVYAAYLKALYSGHDKAWRRAAMEATFEVWKEDWAIVPAYLRIAIPAMVALWIMGM